MAKNTGYTKKVNSLFRSKIDKAVSIVITKNLAIKNRESFLIVYDSREKSLAKRFEKVALALLDKVDMYKIPMMKVNGQEPSSEFRKKLLKYDAAIFLTEKSMSHTKTRMAATKKGIRIASMPSITETIIRRSIDIDYKKLKTDIKKTASLLDKAKKVTIKTKLGTDITFGIRSRNAHGLSAGIYDKKGKWGNLPEGEVFIAPVENTAYGHFVVDGSIAGIGKIDRPIIFFVENGFVKNISNGKKSFEIKKILNKHGEKAKNIAEFGIGFNKKAKVTGVVLEDEKASRTCHLALGNNMGFGGKTDVPLHIDCVMKNPDIYLDDKLVIRRGKLQSKYI